MPDGIDYVTIDGVEYVLTANEGDSKSFDESRVKDIELDPDAFPNADELQQEDNLGRLKIVNQLGLNEEGQFEKLYTFNSRDFTIWKVIKSKKGKVRRMKLVYLSLDEFEQETAATLGTEGFNANYFNPSFDQRSDDKGPEPEGIVVGKCTVNTVDQTLGGMGSSEEGESEMYGQYSRSNIGWNGIIRRR